MALTGLVMLSLVGATQPAPAQWPVRDLTRQIDSLAQATLRDGPTPGLSLAVARGGNVILARGYGYADLEHRIPATPETVYHIGSITKEMTAAAVMQLVEARRLRLDDALTRFIPEYPPPGQHITVRHLLTHTSGIRNYTNLGAKWAAQAVDHPSHEQMLHFFQGEPLEFEPGTRFSYNNSGYYLLGLIIEAASQQPYAGYVEQHLLAPAGLRASRFCEQLPPHSGDATGYTLDQGVMVPATSSGLSPLFSAGGMCSSVLDLIAWQRALIRNSVVTHSAYARMTAPEPLSDGSRPSYGYGVMLGQIEGHRVEGHGGAVEGFAAQLFYFPDDDLTVAVLANAEHAFARRLGEQVGRLVLGIPPRDEFDLPLSEVELRSLAGIYALTDDRLEVWAIGGKLAARFGNDAPFWLRYQGEHRFVAEPDPTLELQFQVRGKRARSVLVTVAGLRAEAVRLTSRNNQR